MTRAGEALRGWIRATRSTPPKRCAALRHQHRAFTSPYLPVPYAPAGVNGLDGSWSWDPSTLSIKGVDANSRSQEYVVVSSMPTLTTDLLARSSASVQGISDVFIRPPEGVPEIVRTTADTITRESNTSYSKALAIQRYLRSAEFTYSLESPVQGGYDGNGLSILADFLAQKSGYCIHYASAMAVMARLEGIPSRIAVGYAPGRPTGQTVSVAGQGALPEYEVDARDAHAWPELYFEGLGWVPLSRLRPGVWFRLTPRIAASRAGPARTETTMTSIPQVLPAPHRSPAQHPYRFPVGLAELPDSNCCRFSTALLASCCSLTAGFAAVDSDGAAFAPAAARIRGQRCRCALQSWAELRDLGH